MNGLLTGLLARRETGLIEEIEKLEKRIVRMETQANIECWLLEDDIRHTRFEADCKLIEEYEEGIHAGLPKEEILTSLVNGAMHRIKATMQHSPAHFPQFTIPPPARRHDERRSGLI